MHILNAPSLEKNSYILHQYERSRKESLTEKSVTELQNVENCRILHKQDVEKYRKYYIYTEFSEP